jgi:hypothetical protein
VVKGKSTQKLEVLISKENFKKPVVSQEKCFIRLSLYLIFFEEIASLISMIAR